LEQYTRQKENPFTAMLGRTSFLTSSLDEDCFSVCLPFTEKKAENIGFYSCRLWAKTDQ